jgi:hypothetical protein
MQNSASEALLRESYTRRGGGSALHAGLIGALLIAGPTYAQAPTSPGAVSEMPLPGGIGPALALLNDPGAPDRSQFLLEIIRRTYRSSVATKDDAREAAVRPLLARLDAASRADTPDTSTDTVPLPLSPSLWIDAVFQGRATPRSLAGAILGSRSAALLYYGMLALDDDTRAWFAGKPGFIAELASRHAAAFMTAAPGLRISGGTVRVPGGKDAEPAWAAVVGRDVAEPESFVRAVVSQRDGMLAYFFASVAQLGPTEIRRVLDLDAPDAARRVDTTRRMYSVYERLAPGWKIDERTFWRPALDPALLVADLAVDSQNRPVVPGTRKFWTLVFAETYPVRGKQGRNEEADIVGDGQPVDLAWISDQVFQGDQVERRSRYEMVLFASRVLKTAEPGPQSAARGPVAPPEISRDAIDAIRAAGRYPALITTLERAGLTDVAVYARAANRAMRLSAIDDDVRAARALAQFQGALAIVTRAALRGTISSSTLATLVTSLCAVDTSERGDYEGRLVHWLDSELLGQLTPALTSAPVAPDASGDIQEAAGPVEHDMLRLIAGAAPSADARFVEWEGTRYRVDLASAEAVRMSRLIGENPRPYLSSARTIAGMADASAEAPATPESLRRDADTIERVAQAVAWDRCRDVSAELQRAARDGDVAAAPRLAAALRLLADDLAARGLKELTYAAAMGQPERAPISADTAATRHDFSLQSLGLHRTGPWRLPVAGGDPVRGWRVSGSLLGLDVRLSEFSLVRLSTKPPKRRPTLNDEDRRAFVDGVALIDPALLTDATRDTIAAAIRTGRTRLAQLRSANDVDVLADAIRLGATRRTLLSWIVAHDPARTTTFLSPIELLWLGLDGAPIPKSLQVWGAPAEGRLGCLCLQLLDRRPFEPLAGRWGSAIFASGFPDLNLRLAELLADMQMPGTLLGPVLASATLEFVNSVNSRDEDDRRGLMEFVQALSPERLEQYLALLTTDGPLVPVSETVGRPAHPGVSR